MATELKDYTINDAIVQIDEDDYSAGTITLRLPQQEDFTLATRGILQDGTEYWTSTTTDETDVRKSVRNPLAAVIPDDKRDVAKEFSNLQSNNYKYAGSTVYKNTSDLDKAIEYKGSVETALNRHISGDEKKLYNVVNYIHVLEDSILPELEAANNMVEEFCSEEESGNYKEAIEALAPEFKGGKEFKNRYIDSAVVEFLKGYGILSRISIDAKVLDDLRKQLRDTPGYVLWKMGVLMSSGRNLPEFKDLFSALNDYLSRTGKEEALNRISNQIDRFDNATTIIDKAQPVTFIAEEIIKDVPLLKSDSDTTLSIVEKFRLANKIIAAKDKKYRVSEGNGQRDLDLAGTLRARIAANTNYRDRTTSAILYKINLPAEDGNSGRKAVRFVLSMKSLEDQGIILADKDTFTLVSSSGNLIFTVFVADGNLIKAISNVVGTDANIEGAATLLKKAADGVEKAGRTQKKAAEKGVLDSKKFVRTKDEEDENKNESLHWYFTESLKNIDKRTKVKHILPRKDGFMFSTKK